MVRITRQFTLVGVLGFLAGCAPPGIEIPGDDSPTGRAFQEIALELVGDVMTLSPAEALDVLDQAVQQENPGSHAHLNSALVALDNGDNVKAIDHLEQFIEKVNKEYGKKVHPDDADFMIFVAESIIDALEEQSGGVG